MSPLHALYTWPAQGTPRIYQEDSSQEGPLMRPAHQQPPQRLGRQEAWEQAQVLPRRLRAEGEIGRPPLSGTWGSRS